MERRKCKALAWAIWPSNRQSFAYRIKSEQGSIEALLRIRKRQRGEMCKGSSPRIKTESNHVR